MLSVNQLSVQIKLTEVWKSQRVENYPIKIDILEATEGQRQTRSVSRGDLVTNGHSQTNQSAFINDATKIWNLAPIDIKESITLNMAKTNINKFVKLLPL